LAEVNQIKVLHLQKKYMKKQTAVDWLVNVVQSCIAPNYIPKEIIKQAKEMEKQQQFNDTSEVTRVEVIQHSEPYNGRAYTNYNAKDVEIQFQDRGKTLKIFLK
jgi:hypothetical protein